MLEGKRPELLALGTQRVQHDASPGCDRPNASLNSWVGIWLEPRGLGDDEPTVLKVLIALLRR